MFFGKLNCSAYILVNSETALDIVMQLSLKYNSLIQLETIILKIQS